MNRKAEILLQRIRKNYEFGTLFTSAGSFFVTLAFALYNGWIGFLGGVFYGKCICVYYLLLLLLRGIILFAERKTFSVKAAPSEIHDDTVLRGSPVKDRRVQDPSPVLFPSDIRRVHLLTSILLLLINLTLVVPVSLMALHIKPVGYGMIPAIAYAAYATYKIINAIRNHHRALKSADLLVRELRNINLIDALVSILSLQNALIVLNDPDPGYSMMVLSCCTSLVFMLLIIAISVMNLVSRRSAKH